ncbi:MULTISPECIES: hypothetical protein [Rhizobium]|uniref:hypothetical protein n=1 Tax=Rhizobium TaxID=379 RepID=UPI001FF01BEC|nr:MULTISPECIES: hypothetical protein [Rhizobium]
MNGPVTWETLSWLVGAISLVVGVCFGIWWKLDAKIRAVEKEAADETDAVRKELADTKIHMAEHYISKAGHRETTDQILRAIEGLGGRIDSLFQSIPAARRPRNSQD